MKLLLCSAAVAVFLFTGCSGEKPAAAPQQQSTPTVAVTPPAQLYVQNCTVCHGSAGSGESPLGSAYPDTNLADASWAHGSSKSDVVESIANGIPGTPMRGFQGLLSPQEIDALADYVLSLSK